MFNYKSLKRALTKSSSDFLFVLLIIQPVLDVISYFASVYSFTIITTAVRLLVFIAVMLYALVLTNKKRVYIAFAGVISLFWIMHITACLLSPGAYRFPVTDAANFLRCVQMPFYTLAFITFFKKGDDAPQKIRLAFAVNFVQLLIFTALSYITGTQIYTYAGKQLGIMGWATCTNAQSAVLALLVPIVLLFAYKKNSRLLFCLSVAVCFSTLFFSGTKVDYFSVFIISAAMAVLFIINREKRAVFYAALLLCVAVCLSCYSFSTVNKVAESHREIVAQKQKYVDTISREEAYELFLGPMVQRFGYNSVYGIYGGTTDMYKLTDLRLQKINFAQLAFEKSRTLTKLFGYEYKTLSEGYNITDANGNNKQTEYNFDPENDFPALLFYYGYVGAALYIIFLLFFAARYLKLLVSDIRVAFSVEAGMIIVTVLIILGAAQFSGNVLRRPNVSVYLSALLAYLYFITGQKKKKRQSNCHPSD